MLSGAKCFVPRKCIFEVSHISERAQQNWGSPAVPSGRWNKEATGKISSAKTGSLLLATIANMWHLREKWVPVAQTLSSPRCSIHLLLPSFRPCLLLVAWCFPLQSPGPAGSLMWHCPALFTFHLKKHAPFLLGSKHSHQWDLSNSCSEVLTTSSGQTSQIFGVSDVAWCKYTASQAKLSAAV